MKASNLLDIRGVRALLLSPWTFRVLRLAAMAALLAMTAWGWHHHGIPGVAVKDPLMYTNLATHLFWVWWLMGVVFLALLLGRFWCAVCPVGWLNDLFAGIGLRRELPVWLRNLVPVTLTLVALQVAVYFLAIHRYPDYTAVLLALMLLLTVAAGLLFRGRAFCHLLCPAGAVFGLYARLAPLQLRVKEQQICATCTGKDCIAGGHAWQRLSLGRAVLFWHGRRPDCPAGLVPSELRDNSACLFCLNCARSCASDNLQLSRRPWLDDLRRGALAAPETFFFLVLFGMLTANFSKVNVPLREAMFWAPQQAALLLGWPAGGYYLLAALWTAVALPLLLLLPGYLLLRLGDFRSVAVAVGPAGPGSMIDLPAPPPRPGVMETLGALVLPYIPLVLATHMVLAIVKINAKAAYLSFVLRDPTGVKSYLAMNVMQTTAPPGVLIPLEVLKWLVLALLAAGWLLSLAGARRAAAGLAAKFSTCYYMAASVVGITLVTGLYAATVIRWLFIR